MTEKVFEIENNLEFPFSHPIPYNVQLQFETIPMIKINKPMNCILFLVEKEKNKAEF